MSTQSSGNATKLEWVTCPSDSITFQIAVPSNVTDMRVSRIKPYITSKYCIEVICPKCKQSFYIETNLSAFL